MIDNNANIIHELKAAVVDLDELKAAAVDLERVCTRLLGVLAGIAAPAPGELQPAAPSANINNSINNESAEVSSSDAEGAADLCPADPRPPMTAEELSHEVAGILSTWCGPKWQTDKKVADKVRRMQMYFVMVAAEMCGGGPQDLPEGMRRIYADKLLCTTFDEGGNPVAPF